MKNSDKQKNKQAKNFERWIKQQLIARNMLLQDLADQTGMHIGSLSNIFGGKRDPSVKTCKKIADVLGVPVESVFRAIGYIPTEDTELKREFRNLRETMLQLNEKNRNELIEYAQFKLRTQLAEEATKDSTA